MKFVLTQNLKKFRSIIPFIEKEFPVFYQVNSRLISTGELTQTQTEAPANLTATPQSTSILLDWDDVSGATYSVYSRRTDVGGAYSLYPGASGLVDSEFEATDVVLDENTDYDFVVTAQRTGELKSEYSNSVTEQIFVDPMIVSQLRFTGANGSTAFTDDYPAGTPRLWTPVNGASIDTDATAAAGVSGNFDGVNDRIQTPNTADLNLTGDRIFCVDMFVKKATAGMDSLAAQWTNFSGSTTNGCRWILYTTEADGLAVYIVNAAVNDVVTSEGVAEQQTVPIGAWAHVAFYKPALGNGGYYLAVDGVVWNVLTGAANIMGDGPNPEPLTIADLANSPSQNPLNGRIQGFRIRNGTCPYGATNFTPPTPPFSAP